MTNRERAQKVFDEIHEPFYGHKPHEEISIIERALDEKDAECKALEKKLDKARKAGLK